jgi:hypothetical protein
MVRTRLQAQFQKEQEEKEEQEKLCYRLLGPFFLYRRQDLLVVNDLARLVCLNTYFRDFVWKKVYESHAPLPAVLRLGNRMDLGRGTNKKWKVKLFQQVRFLRSNNPRSRRGPFHAATREFQDDLQFRACVSYLPNLELFGHSGYNRFEFDTRHTGLLARLTHLRVVYFHLTFPTSQTVLDITALECLEVLSIDGNRLHVTGKGLALKSLDLFFHPYSCQSLAQLNAPNLEFLRLREGLATLSESVSQASRRFPKLRFFLETEPLGQCDQWEYVDAIMTAACSLASIRLICFEDVWEANDPNHPHEIYKQAMQNGNSQDPYGKYSMFGELHPQRWTMTQRRPWKEISSYLNDVRRLKIWSV